MSGKRCKRRSAVRGTAQGPRRWSSDRSSGRRRLFMCRLTSTLLVTALVLFAPGCSVQRTPGLNSAKPGEPAPSRAVVPVVLGGEIRQSDPFRLNSASVDDDVLTLVVDYSGGCRDREFTLRAPRSFQESAGSVQLAVTLIHDANGDRCEANPTEQLRFGLRPISRLFQDRFNRDSGTVYLRLAGHAGPLVYRF